MLEKKNLGMLPPSRFWEKKNSTVFISNGYEAVYEWVTERVLREDKTHSTGLTMSDPDILVPNEPWRP